MLCKSVILTENLTTQVAVLILVINQTVTIQVFFSAGTILTNPAAQPAPVVLFDNVSKYIIFDILIANMTNIKACMLVSIVSLAALVCSEMFDAYAAKSSHIHRKEVGGWFCVAWVL